MKSLCMVFGRSGSVSCVNAWFFLSTIIASEKLLLYSVRHVYCIVILISTLVRYNSLYCMFLSLTCVFETYAIACLCICICAFGFRAVSLTSCASGRESYY